MRKAAKAVFRVLDGCINALLLSCVDRRDTTVDVFGAKNVPFAGRSYWLLVIHTPQPFSDVAYGRARAPFFRASERPIATACLRFATFFLLRPLLSVPSLNLRMAVRTVFWLRDSLVRVIYGHPLSH